METVMRLVRDYTLCSLHFVYLYSWIILQPDSQNLFPCAWMWASVCIAYLAGHQICSAAFSCQEQGVVIVEMSYIDYKYSAKNTAHLN